MRKQMKRPVLYVLYTFISGQLCLFTTMEETDQMVLTTDVSGGLVEVTRLQHVRPTQQQQLYLPIYGDTGYNLDGATVPPTSRARSSRGTIIKVWI